jgi:hypothetical protein
MCPKKENCGVTTATLDPATRWFDIKEVPGTKTADVTTNTVEQTWLTAPIHTRKKSFLITKHNLWQTSPKSCKMAGHHGVEKSP